MKTYYGISKVDLRKMKLILAAANLPLTGYMPNKSPRKNGKFVIKHINKRTQYIREDKSTYPDGFYTVNGHISVLYKIRTQLLFHEPINIRE